MTVELLREPTVCRVSSPSGGDGIEAGIRDATDVPVVTVGSTGARALEPLLLVTHEGETAFFAGCTASRANDVGTRLDEGKFPAEQADAVVEHDAVRPTVPIPDLAPLDAGTRSVLARCGWVRPTDPEDYRSTGGFETLNADADALVEAARGVDGHGWGDAVADGPVGETWERVADAAGDPAVVVNAHGAPGDALLCESTPFLPLEGALAAARVVDADDVVVYLSAADERARDRVSAAVGDLPASGPTVRVETGPDDYRAAEPTMALEAIEGTDRIEARLRPPGPTAEGLYGRPTLVHTPRTLSRVVVAAAGAGPTRVVTVRGDVRDEATIELTRGESLSILREAVTVDGTFKAACVGGRLGGLTADLDVAATPDALEEAGLGAEGIVEVLGERRCVVADVLERAAFGRERNCGRCVPCREGSKQLANLLEEVYGGEFRPEGIEELLRVIRSSSICAFGRDLTRPVATALDRFEDEFAAHADGRCPTGTCTGAHAPEVAP